MKCPECKLNAPVYDSREYVENTRRRRYRCTCGCRFTTLEEIVYMNDEMKGRTGYARHTKLPDIVHTLRRAKLRKEVSAELRAEIRALLGDAV